MAGRPRLHNDQEREHWRSLAQQGMSAHAIALQLNISWDIIAKHLKESGLFKRTYTKNTKITPEQRAVIIRKYNAGECGSTTLAREYKVDKGTIRTILNRHGDGTRPRHDRVHGEVKVRTKTGVKQGGWGHALADMRHDIFSVLSPVVEYWLGYVICDGCPHWPDDRSTPRLFMVQGMCHRDHLENFRTFIGSTCKISEGTHLDPAGVEQQDCSLAITSLQMCTDLARYGMIGLKPTRFAKDARLLNSPHFWRGCVDADGNISSSKPTMYLSGHLPLLSQWEEYVGKITQSSVHKHEQPGCFRYILNAAASRLMAKHLYIDHAGECLPDKLSLARRVAGM